jgi:hypothetical protein
MASVSVLLRKEAAAEIDCVRVKGRFFFRTTVDASELFFFESNI